MLFMYPLRIWISQFDLNYAIQIPLTTLIVAIGSYMTTYVISRFSLGKYLISC